jgi:amino acid transporter
MATTQDVFIRKSSGLTRQISPRDALMYCAQNPGLLYCFVYIVWAPAFYPGVNMTLGVLTVLLFFPIAALYWYFSVAMPRSGGEYVYISRTLHPSLGLWASFMISATAVSWTGTIQDWWIRWGLNDAIRAVGIARGADTWINVANTLDQSWIRFLIGTVSIVVLLTWLYLLGTKAMMRVSYWAVAFAWLAVIILGVLVLVTGQRGFEENFNRLSGTDYQAILQAGRHAGAIFGIGAFATLYGGLTYIGLNTLGQTFSANLAGEIRGVSKSQALALFGSLAMQMVIWFAAYQLVYSGVGVNFMHSIDSLWNARFSAVSDPNALYPPTMVHAHTSSEPVPMLLMAFFTGNPILILLFGISFIVATWVSLAGLGFAPIRNVFAWSFDRMIPTRFADIRTRYRAPVYSIAAIIVVAEIYFILQVFRPSYVGAIAFTIIAWFLAWAVLGVAGILFPFRRKELFQGAPPSVQRRLGGMPVVSILGFVTLAVSVMVEWFILKPFFEGSLSWSQLVTVGVMAAIPVVIYAIAHFYHNRKGIPLALQFSEVPPE